MTAYVTTWARNFRTTSLFSQNCPELCGENSARKKLHQNEFISVWKLSGNEGKFCGKNLSMEMSLFMYGNSVEMRETEENSAEKT